jgi:hypothetical protein
MALPNYVRFFPPAVGSVLTCSGTTLYGFPIPVTNFSSLATTCQKYFDVPTSGAISCTPLAPWVMLTIDQILWLGDGTSLGIVENEALLQIPVKIDDHTTGNSFYATFTPYAVVDNPISLTGGREVYGFAKGYGFIHGLPRPPRTVGLGPIPTPPPLLGSSGGAPLELSAKVFGGNANDLYLDYHLLLSITPQAPGPPFSPLDILLKEIFLFAWSSIGARQIFLKEFQDVNDLTKACLQQVTKVDYKIIGNPQLTILMNLFNLTVTPLDSHDVCATLGIPSQSVVWGYESILDFQLTNGSVLWP